VQRGDLVFASFEVELQRRKHFYERILQLFFA
jgi:hypothetical protein